MTALFLGNGLNYFTPGQQTGWSDVLNILRHEFYFKNEIGVNGVPFLIQFDSLVQEKLGAGFERSDNFRQFICRELEGMGYNWAHNQVIASGYSHIITTNYDHTLQSAYADYIGCELPVSRDRSPRYNLKRKYRVNMIKLWHAHGDIKTPKSIKIGLADYIDQLGVLRAYISKRDVMEGYDGDPDSWVDVFMNEEIDIRGFGATFDEIEFWWLLGVRHELRIKRGKGMDITCHVHENDGQKPHFRRMRELGVKITAYPSHEDIYRSIPTRANVGEF